MTGLDFDVKIPNLIAQPAILLGCCLLYCFSGVNSLHNRIAFQLIDFIFSQVVEKL